jgi:Uma2 family endonuclease
MAFLLSFKVVDRQLPSSEEPEESGLPDEFHLHQAQRLELTFRPPNWDADLVFVGSDLNLYYAVTHANWYKRPNWLSWGCLGYMKDGICV